MKISKKGILLIKNFESLHDGDLTTIGLQPKMDPVGIWTEGYGHAIRDNKGNFIKGSAYKVYAYSFSKVNTEEQAHRALLEDIKSFELILARRVTTKLNQNQIDALISHTFNTGGSDTLFSLINKKESNEKINNWFTSRYIMSGGEILPGLVRRRKAEATLFFTEPTL